MSSFQVHPSVRWQLAAAVVLGLVLFLSASALSGPHPAHARDCEWFQTSAGVEALCTESLWDEVPIIEQITFAWNHYFG